VYTREERIRGFRAAVAHGGRLVDERWCAPTKTSSNAGYERASTLLAAGSPPDGILCHSDAVAFGLMHALADSGLRVGTDVRVVGFDDLELSRHSSPALTSISVEARQMGKAAVDLLLRQMQGEPAGDPVVFAPRLEVRESCGAVRS
jgi:LacI family transcriptional regulator